jgi:hypothetical protein
MLNPSWDASQPMQHQKIEKDMTAPLPQLPTSFLIMWAQIAFIVFVNVLSAMNTIPFLDNSFGEGLQEGSLQFFCEIQHQTNKCR